MKGAYQTPRRGNYAGSYEMPRVNTMKCRYNYAVLCYQHSHKGAVGRKCPGAQGHEDFVQVQYTQGWFCISGSPPCKCMLFSKEETKEALQKIKEKPECNVIYKPPPEPDMGPHTLEEYAFMGSRYSPSPLKERHLQSSMN